MHRIKAHVRTNSTATIICPACNTVKNIAADSFRLGKHRLRIRCRCNEQFQVDLDFRRHYRKPTSLTGYYSITSSGGVGGGVIHIHNISRGGLGFSVSGIHQIEKDQTMDLEFELNDKNRTVLKKSATVRSVQGNHIGCEFQDKERVEKALGFYLQG